MKDLKRKKILEKFARMKELENKPANDLTAEEYSLMYSDLNDVDWDEDSVNG